MEKSASRKLTGLKIRAYRKQAGLTQAELARRVGISAPYLNLIEGNRRSVAGALLNAIAEALGIDAGDLDGGAERRMVQELQELASDPRFSSAHGAPSGAEDLVGSHAGWSTFILRLARAYEDQSQAILALADRLNRDPFLGETVHEMLTSAASMSSAAEILGHDDLTSDQRHRFGEIVSADSAKLSETARSLLAYFDSAEVRVRSATPMEHVDAFIFGENNHFPQLEQLAQDHLRGGGHAQFDKEAALREARIADAAAAPETRRFALLRGAAASIGSEAIEDITKGHKALPTDEARRLAGAALLSYLTGAMLMPYDSFLEAAERKRYDIDALCRQFGVSYEQAAHRLATLRRPGAEGVHFAFMRSDMSGYVTKRLPLPGLSLPRFATACPLWVVYGAFQSPGSTVRHFGELPSGDQFLFFARAIDKVPPRIGYPRKLLSVMLACSAADAGRVVYGDGLDRTNAMVEVGTVCRLCQRHACAYRQEAPLLETAGVSDKRRMAAAAPTR
ncbi:MAG: DUF2083 domain-containing protein [Rhizobiaceae bacterium]|nr:DUF2083 domain-containing protein [Rhizobiaceae bacterium]